jgi:septum formation protein
MGHLPPLVLASASPRRAALLRELGLPLLIQPAHLAEDPQPPANRAVQELARRKAQVVWQPGSWTLGADTLVELSGRLLGKPKTLEVQARFLKALSGRSHLVHSAFCLIDPQGGLYEGREEVRVQFRELSEAELSWYLASQEGLDKAGGYGIQGLARVFVKRLEGDYYSVVGLPIAQLWETLWRAGYLERA